MPAWVLGPDVKLEEVGEYLKSRGLKATKAEWTPDGKAVMFVEPEQPP